ncbi:Odorant receptor 98 [Blattella germanica]|nr:Odorant receptor 98 [Blattella germanica]
MESQSTDLIMKRFKFIIYLWRFVGVPMFLRKPSMVYKIYQAVTWLLMVSFPIFNCLDAYENRDNVARAAISLRTAFPMCIMLMPHTAVSLNLELFETLFHKTDTLLWEDMPEKDPVTGQLTIAGWIPRTMTLVKCGIIGSIFAHAVQVTDRIRSHELTTYSWYPFDCYSSPAYEITNFVQVIQALMAICSMYAFIGVYALHLEIACTQLDKLTSSLLAIRQTSDSQEDFKAIEQELNRSIVHHQQILEYMQALENAMNFSICTIFLFLMATLCIISFSAVKVLNDPVELEQVIHLNIVFTIYLFILCGFGTLLTNKAQYIAEAAYGVDWVGTPLSIQSSILIIITQSNKEFTLTAGKFVPVSNKTMLSILSEAWSLFMFLLQVQDPEANN